MHAAIAKWRGSTKKLRKGTFWFLARWEGFEPPDRLVRSQELYPTELPAHRGRIIFAGRLGVNLTRCT